MSLLDAPLAGPFIGILELLSMAFSRRVISGQKPAEAAISALEDVATSLPAFLAAEWEAAKPTFMKWLLQPAPPESQGVYGEDDARRKKGEELVASGDALPQQKE
jgi:hypothetical protein